jgi:nitrite reductase/ring-hydroxylating ferredoxin subunit
MRGQPKSPQRRAFLCRSAALGLAVVRFGDVSAQDDPHEQRPTAGDRLVRADSDAGSVPLKVDDVLPDAKKPLVAVPYDIASKTVRDGSKLNRVLLIRVDGEVVAFSAICTHEACSVSEWLPAEQHLLCPCHFSKYDVRDGGAVVEGPAPRNLPSLPLRHEPDGELVVDGGFSAQPGVRRTA